MWNFYTIDSKYTTNVLIHMKEYVLKNHIKNLKFFIERYFSVISNKLN